MDITYTISHQDAIKLRNYQGAEEIIAAMDIYKALYNEEKDTTFILSALYHAAFIAGIRHERYRRHRGWDPRKGRREQL